MTKKTIIIMLAVVLTCFSLKAETLTELLYNYNSILGEPDSSEAFLPDTVKRVFLNMGLQKITFIAGILQKYTQFRFVRDSGYYNLPSDFSRIKGVLVKSKGHWYTVFNDPEFKLADTSKMRYSISWSSGFAAQINLAFGDLVPDQVDILYSPDSIHYDLPDDFRRDLGVMVYRSGYWGPAFLNPFFIKDTSVPVYFAYPDDSVGGDLYLRGTNMVEDDTIRVFYYRTAKTGDSVRVLYHARAAKMDSLADTTDFPSEMEPFVLDEAVNYYYEALRAFNVQQALYQQSRIDLGIIKSYKEPGVEDAKK